MTSATRIASSVLGAYAGVLGIQHGLSEMMQGSAPPQGLLINAIGPPCQAEAVWHACYPALTVVPSLQATGLLAVVASLCMVVWAVASVDRRLGGLVPMILAAAMLLVGGGFVAPFIGLVAAVAGMQAGVPPRSWRSGSPHILQRTLGRLWPWPLVALVLWAPGAWVMGHFLNREMLSLGFVLFLLFDLLLPVLGALAAWAYDVQTHIESEYQTSSRRR